MEHIRVNESIRLESVKPSMATVIFEAVDENRKFLRKWLPFVDYTLHVSDTEKFLKSLSKPDCKKGDETYSIWYREHFAGLIGFKDTDWVNRKTELGYWIVEKMQGKGIITLSVKELTKYAFRKLKLNRIQIKVADGNKKSSSIPLKLGFKYEGKEREGEYHNPQYFNLEIYSLLKSEWGMTSE